MPLSMVEISGEEKSVLEFV